MIKRYIFDGYGCINLNQIGEPSNNITIIADYTTWMLEKTAYSFSFVTLLHSVFHVKLRRGFRGVDGHPKYMLC